MLLFSDVQLIKFDLHISGNEKKIPFMEYVVHTDLA
jgi:hypothetical protein